MNSDTKKAMASMKSPQNGLGKYAEMKKKKKNGDAPPKEEAKSTAKSKRFYVGKGGSKSYLK